MTALVSRVGKFLVPLPALMLLLSCSDAGDREPMRNYVISDAAISIPRDTDVRVEVIIDYFIHSLSNRRLNVEILVYEGFAPNFQRESAVAKERIGGFPAWRLPRDDDGHCGSEILVDLSSMQGPAAETAPYLHFFYQSADRQACSEAEKIVSSLQAK